jgi:hypothetical protein
MAGCKEFFVHEPTQSLRRRLALPPAQFRFQFADALLRFPGALLAGGDDLAVGVAPAQPGVPVALKFAFPQAQTQTDMFPGAGVAELVFSGGECKDAQCVLGKQVLGVEDRIVRDAKPGIEVFLERLLAAGSVGPGSTGNRVQPRPSCTGRTSRRLPGRGTTVPLPGPTSSHTAAVQTGGTVSRGRCAGADWGARSPGGHNRCRGQFPLGTLPHRAPARSVGHRWKGCSWLVLWIGCLFPEVTTANMGGRGRQFGRSR